MSDPKPRRKMIEGIGLLILAALFFFLVMWSFGCTTTETVYERVEVPVPYWDPPTVIVQLPPRPTLQAGDVSPADAESDPREALRILGQDLSIALAWGERLAFLYSELVKLVEADPPAPPPTGDPE